MWAQLISGKLKAGRENDLSQLIDALRAAEQSDSPLVRAFALQDQKDPSRVYMLPIFASEAAARERESDPRRQEAMKSVQALMGDLFEGGLEFVDLNVVDEMTT